MAKGEWVDSAGDINNLLFSITPPASLDDTATITISFQLSASFGPSAAPWAMISAAGGSMAGGADIQTTAFTYDEGTNTYTLIHVMPATAANGSYALRQLDLRDQAGNLISFTASYFELQGIDFEDTLSTAFADNTAPSVGAFAFSDPVQDGQDGSWLINATFEATDASGIRSVDAYLSLRNGSNLWSEKAYHYEALTSQGDTSHFAFRLPSYARSGDYSLLYVVTDNANNTRWYQSASDLAFTHIENPDQDITPPQARNFSVSGAFVRDASGSLRPVLHITGSIDFGASGNSSTNLLVYNPDHTPQNNHYVGYNIQPDAEGVFAADVSLASPSPDGHYALQLECIDGAGNVTRLVSDSHESTAPPGSTLLSSLGWDGELFVYAPDESYDPAQGITMQSTQQDAILFDGEGNDTLIGDIGSNGLIASAGADHLDGGAGNDTLNGGAGGDELIGGDGNDVVNAGSGNDLIVGGNGAGNDIYKGGSGTDTVRYTSALNDITVNLATGQATSLGGVDDAHIGTDALFSIENVIAGHHDDVIFGNAVANRIEGMDGNDRISGSGGNDTLDGGAGADRMLGGTGNDRLRGGTGSDSLGGGAGDDRLAGGAGRDTLTGGTGSDTFVFDTAPTSRDTITDFSRTQADRILLSKAVFKAFAYTGTLHAEDFHAAAGATAARDASDRIIYNTATGVLYYDVDGLGGMAALAVAKLGTGTHPTLTYADLLIIG